MSNKIISITFLIYKILLLILVNLQFIENTIKLNSY